MELLSNQILFSPTHRNTNSMVEVQTPKDKSAETASNFEFGTSKIILKDDVVDGEKSEMKATASHDGAKVEIQSIVSDKQKQKRRFSISLSKEEIEADILATGGSKRIRRTKKKRAKDVQRILDNLFPGLRLK